MGSHAVLDRRIWAAGYDLTGDSNSVTMPIAHEEKDDTRFGMTGRSRLGGLENVELSAAGFWQAGSGTVDPELFTGMGSTLQVFTVSTDIAESSVAYFFQGKKFSYERFGAVGDVTPFSLKASGTKGNGTLSAGAVRGRTLKANATVSATGATGTAYQLGAVSATQYLYASFHVFTAPTTITAVLESAAASDFVGATTRITFGPITTVGGTWGTRVAGAITDTWYRIRITAITGSGAIAAAAGIK